MEGYKSLKETVLSVAGRTGRWIYIGTGDSFDLDDMIATAEYFDKTFPLDEDSYFICFPDGEIGMLGTSGTNIERLFVPFPKDATEEATAGDGGSE